MKKINTIVNIATLFLAAVSMTSCNAIYDDEDTRACDPEEVPTVYKVKFRYDMNMKFADAFSSQVEAVTLYVLNENDEIVQEKSEQGDALKAEGYAMELDTDLVKPGKYTLLAWCTSNERDTWTFGSKEKSSGDRFSCTLNANSKDKSNQVDYDIDALYYGKLADVEFTDEAGEQVVTVPLIKDTNRVRVVLQSLSGEKISADDYDFYINAENGKMAADNSTVKGYNMEYHPWYKSQTNADNVSTDGTTLNAAVGELNISRLVVEDESRLTVYNKSKDTPIISIPLKDYLLLVKGHENVNMSDQEYLDRQDEYNLIFFLDESGCWIDDYIYINSWYVVPDNPKF